MNWYRYLESTAIKQPVAERLQILNEAYGFVHEALKLTPPDAILDLAALYNNQSAILDEGGQSGPALQSAQEALRLYEAVPDAYQAAGVCYSISRILANRAPTR